jgi:hypothetical protein
MSTPANSGSEPASVELGQLLPLTPELITSVLDARGFTYFTDDDGDIGGRWLDNLIFFLRLGGDREVLQVRTMTRSVFTIDDVSRLYEFCNAWNHDRLWPKAYVHVDDDGRTRILGEVTSDLEKGVTVAQLDLVLACGIATGCQLADAVAEL